MNITRKKRILRGIDMYSADEFITQCLLGGYASKKTASEYAKGKDKLTDKDLIEVFRINERKNDLKHYRDWAVCDMDGDDLINDLARSPIPWEKDIDLNRGVRHLREKQSSKE